ncbi:MAG: hypothetical protein QHH07_11930 [Sedimentisphaerales bacterium]|nr:hypothetical protein [Sedimentisphaerales bacterium]
MDVAGQEQRRLGGPKAIPDGPVKAFIDGLTVEERMLIVLKAQLYGGRWEPMLDDLKNRLEGKPYIFKLINRIRDDIQRIEGLQEFEAKYHVDLSEYVDLQQDRPSQGRKS